MQYMELKLGTHVYLSISMTTIDKKIASGTFSSSLLKLAHHTMRGGETWYACVFQRFHDDHEQKLPQALFLITTSSLLKLSNHAMHRAETWYACVFERFHDNH